MGPLMRGRGTAPPTLLFDPVTLFDRVTPEAGRARVRNLRRKGGV